MTVPKQPLPETIPEDIRKEFQLLWYEVEYLKERMKSQEQYPAGISFINDYVCKHCNRRYSTGWCIVCGAMPKCPYCGKLQVWWEEPKK